MKGGRRAFGRGFELIIEKSRVGKDGDGAEILRGVVDALPDGVAVLDARGVVVFANRRWLQGRAPHAPGHCYAPVGANLIEALRAGSQADASFADRLRDGLEALLAREQSRFSLEYPVDAPGGREWFLFEAEPFEAGGVMLRRADISGLKREKEAEPRGEADDRRQLGDLAWVYHNAPIGLCLLDLDLRYVRINRALAELNGQPVEAHIGRSVDELVPALAPRVKRVTRRILATRRACRNVEFRGETAARPGALRYWNSSWHPILDAKGNIVGFGAVVEETTERRAAEKALQESERRERRRAAELQAIFDTAPIGLAITVDPRGERIAGNRALEATFGLPEGAELSTTAPAPFRAFQGEREIPVADLPMQRAAGGEVVAGEILEIAPVDGRRVTVFAKATPLYDEAGEPRGAVGAFLDITKIKRAEKVLRDSEAQFRAMFELTGVGMAQADYQTGRLLRVNETLARMLGYTREELLEKSFIDFMHPDDRAADWERFARMARAETRTYDVEKRCVRKDGSCFWVRVAATLIGDPGAPGTRTLAVIQDVSAQKRVESDLRESEARLQQALDAANAGVWEYFPQTGVFTASARAKALHGLAPDTELTCECALAAVVPDDQRAVEAAMRKSLETGAQFLVELRAPLPDGSLRWLSSIAELRGEGAGRRFVGLVQDIDERKRNEVALRESDERQAFLLRLTDCLRQLVDTGEIQAAACRLLGEHLGVNRVCYADIDGDEFIVRQSYAKDVAPFMVRMLLSDLGEALIDSFRREETVAIEDVFADAAFTAEERERFRAGDIAALASVVLTKQGRWVGALCAHNATPRSWSALEIRLVRDVAERIWSATERARVQAALRESELRLQLALESGDIGIHEWRLDSGEVIWDERMRAQFLLPPGAPVSHEDFLKAIHPADRATVQAEIERATAPRGDGRYACEFRIASGDDAADRWIAMTGQAFFAGTRAIRVVGTAQDITKRKRAEAERQKFVSLAEQSLDFIGICNMRFQPRYVNPAGLRLVGHDDLDHAMQVEVRDYFFPEDQDFIYKEFFPRVMREGHAAVEIRFRHFKTGEALWMLYNVFFLRDPEGEPIGLATVSRDITERRRFEDALKAADRRKDEFLATLAHELRNPLAPIRNAVHVLRHESDVGAGHRARRDLALLAMIERQTEHLVRLVDDLLEVSRITRGKIDLKKQRIDLAEVLRHALETAAPAVSRGGHHLDLALPPEPLLVDGDPVRLAQVFTNLLNNAAKYTERGGNIWVAARPEGRDIVVTVRDSGVGIPAEMLPRVFDLFTQVDRTLGRAEGGLGIGLALVRSLLELHGGTVEAQSEGLGRGSVFVVRLPAATGAETEDAMSEAPATAKAAVPRRVLVVDDDHDVADSLAMFLETFGAEVRVAYDGIEGLDALACFRPELVFLDLGMPQMDGYETARRIRASPEGRDVLLVALSGWGEGQVSDLARDAGFDRQLTKPASFEALQELLASR